LEGLEDRCLPAADPLAAVTDVEKVARLIGPSPPSINDTVCNWNVRGADLGSMFDLDGKLYMVFGDTFGPPAPPQGGAGGSDWRSNTMAVISNWEDPQQGLYFDSMINDQPGEAKALIQGLRGDKYPNGDTEVTKIPSYGIASDTPNGPVMYLDVQSINQWGPIPGQWTVNWSAIYYSDDLGQTWQKSCVHWGPDSNFAQVAIVRVGDEATPANNMLYFFGIPAGRFGSVELARVPELQILDQCAYQYWGTENGQPAWTSDEHAAVPIVNGPVGELSVMWDPYVHRWLMTYLNVGVQGGNDPTLQMRDAPQLTGPWSQPHTITDSLAYPELYGAFMHPLLTQNDGKDIYFTMSQFGPYTVDLMHATLVAPATTSYDPLNGTWSILGNLPNNNITLRVVSQPGSGPVIEAWEGDSPGVLTQEFGSIPAADVRAVDLTLAGGSALDVDDSADTIGRTVTITGTSITGLQSLGGPGGIHFNGNHLTSLTVDTGAGNDTIDVGNADTLDDLLWPLQVNGGGGADTLTLNGQLDGASTYDVDSDLLLVHVPARSLSVRYSGMAGVVLDGSSAAANAFEVNRTPAGTSYTLNGGSGDDTFDLTPPAVNAGGARLGALGGPVTVGGGGGNDTLTFNDQYDGAST
jgi:hypothetical protein